MSRRYSRRFFLAGLGGVGASAALAEAPLVSLRPRLRPAQSTEFVSSISSSLVNSAGLGAHSKTAYVLCDARTGEVLDSLNPLLPQPPASVAKAITALYGLDRLGPAHRFKTRVLATGPVSGGRLEGDLVLVGGGDPTLDTDEMAELVKQVKDAGVQSVTGSFLVYGGALPYARAIDHSQPDYLGYNPAVSGLNLNFNRVYFEWKRAESDYQISLDARALRYRPAVQAARMQIIDRSQPIYTYEQSNNVDSWTVARKALGNEGGRWLPVRKPSLYAAEVFGILARGEGINLGAARQVSTLPAGHVIAQRQSDPLTDMLRGMLRHSTNLTAEAVGMSASAQERQPTGLRNSATAMADWLEQEHEARRARFVDHSGLGDDSRISAREMVRTLVQVGPDGPLRPILKKINVRDLSAEVRAKTGTLNFVSGLAGYVTSPQGRELTFAVFSSDLERRRAIPRAERERPAGARGWSRRARNLQYRLIKHWVQQYGA